MKYSMSVLSGLFTGEEAKFVVTKVLNECSCAECDHRFSSSNGRGRPTLLSVIEESDKYQPVRYPICRECLTEVGLNF